MCENGTMRPVEIVLRRVGVEDNGEVNLTKIYCKLFCNCHNVLPVQREYANKFKKRSMRIVV
jgi:hypothetical protein